MTLFTLTTNEGALLEVLSGRISMPDMGAWSARIELGEDAAPAGAIVLNVGPVADAQEHFSGMVIDGGAHEGRGTIVLQGGAGGLLGAAAQTDYRAAPTPITAYDLVREILAGAGEVEADGLVDELAGRAADRWTRAAGETWERALGRVVRRWGLSWRVLDAGSIWAGSETWPEAELDGRELDVDPEARRVAVAFDRATARPGTTIGGRRITRVVFTSEGRATLLFAPGSEREDFAGAVRAVAEPDPYALIWWANVVRQNDDGSLDLALPEGPFAGDLLGVPFEPGLQCKMTIAVGALVRLAFAGGSPDGAFAYGRVHDQTAAAAVAREGDSVDLGYLTGTAPPGGGPVVFGLSPVAIPNSVHLTGTITSGSPILRIP